MMLVLVLVLSLAYGVNSRATRAQFDREKRSDDVSVSSLQALLEQQAAAIQTLKSELAETKSDTSNRLNAAESKLSVLGTKLAHPIAFTVHFSSDPVSIGTKATLKFDHFVTNIGGGYDPNTGIFTAPVAGLYAFYLNLMDDQESEIEIRLVKNGATVDIALGNGNLAQGSYLTTLHLIKGDKVWNEHYWGPLISEDIAGLSSPASSSRLTEKKDSFTAD